MAQSIQLTKEFVKIRCNEPKVSTGLNRKFFGVVPNGVYAGFHIKPSENDREVIVYSDEELDCAGQCIPHADTVKGWSSAVIETFGGYNVTINMPRGPVGQIPLNYTDDFDGQILYIVLRGVFTVYETNAYLEFVEESWIDQKRADCQVDFIVVGHVNTPASGGKVPKANIAYFDAKHSRTLPYANESKFGFLSPEQIRRINSLEDSSLVYAFDGDLDFQKNNPDEVTWDQDINLIFATRGNRRVLPGAINLLEDEIAYVEVDKGAGDVLEIKTQSSNAYRFEDGNLPDVAAEDNFLPIDLEKFDRVYDLESDVSMTVVPVSGGGNALKNALDSATGEQIFEIEDSLNYRGEIDIFNLNKIVVRAKAGEAPTINGEELDRYGFKIYGNCEDVYIKLFTIADMAPSPTDFHTQSGIVFGNGQNVTTDNVRYVVIEDIEMIDTGRSAISSSKSPTGVDNVGEYAIRDVLIKNVNVTSMEYPSVTPTNLWENAFILRNTRGFTLYENSIRDVNGSAMLLVDNRDLVVRNNFIERTLDAESTRHDGLIFDSNDNVNYPVSNAEVVNNVFKETPTALSVFSVNGYYDLTINHNIFTENDDCINMINQNALRIRNNSFFDNAGIGINLNGGNADVDYCHFEDNGTNISDNLQIGQNSIFGPPLFTDPDNNDYSIDETSPLYRAGSDGFDIGLFDIEGHVSEASSVAFRKIIFFRKDGVIYTEILPEGRILTWGDSQVGAQSDSLIERTQKLSLFQKHLIQERNFVFISQTLLAPIYFAIGANEGEFHVVGNIILSFTDSEREHVIEPVVIDDIEDGECIYYEVPRASSPSNITLLKTDSPLNIPHGTGQRNFRLFGFRRGNRFILFSGNILNDGQSGPIYGGNAPEFTFIHDIGVQNVSNAARFRVTNEEPASKSSVQVYFGSTKLNFVDDYDINYVTNGFDVTLVEEAPEPSEIKVFYPTITYRAADAVIIASPPGGSGDEEVEIVKLSSTDISNKEIQLQNIPSNPDHVLIFLDTGANLENGLHYNVTGDIVSWDGTPLDGLIDDNNTMIILYWV